MQSNSLYMACIDVRSQRASMEGKKARMNYSHIVFDIDGTLMDSESAILHAFQELMLELTGEEIPQGDLTFILGIPGEDALKRLGIADPHAANARYNELLRKYAHTIKAFDGLDDVLHKLHQRGIQLGLVTSETRAEVEADFASLSIAKYFDVLVCADDTELHKPHPDPLLHYMLRTRSRPEELLYIGDSSYDMQCALSAGVDRVLALWNGHTQQDLQADYYFKQPIDILDVL